MLVVGGYDGSTDFAATEVPDIDTMTFSPGPVMSVGRSAFVVVSLSGLIIVVGGYAGNDGLNMIQAIFFPTMAFAAGPAMLTVRSGCAALALLRDRSPRRILIVGGSDATSIMVTTEVLTA